MEIEINPKKMRDDLSESIDNPWVIHGLSMDFPELSMDAPRITIIFYLLHYYFVSQLML